MEDCGIRLVAEEGASLSSGSLRLYAQLTCRKEKTVIGCIDLYNYDPLNRRCAVGIMVINDYRRQGCATSMLGTLEKMATDTFGLHQLYADIASANTASRGLFQKAGYTECGRFKEWLELDSHFIDNIRMQKILWDYHKKETDC